MVENIQTVSYVRQFNPEGIFSLAPSLVLGPEGLNLPTIVDQLENAMVKVQLIPESSSCDDTKSNIVYLGANLDATSEVVELIAILESDLILLDKDLKTKTYLPKKKVMMIYV